MFLNNLVAFRCSKEIYDKLKKISNNNPAIENTSHAIRIAVMKYIREEEKKDV